MAGACVPVASISSTRPALFEQPKVVSINGASMLRALAAIEESWIWAGGLQDRHFPRRAKQRIRPTVYKTLGPSERKLPRGGSSATHGCLLEGKDFTLEFAWWDWAITPVAECARMRAAEQPPASGR